MIAAFLLVCKKAGTLAIGLELPPVVLKLTRVDLKLFSFHTKNSRGKLGDEDMLKKLIAALVLSSAVALGPYAALAEDMHHHHHHHHEHHHHHHHHDHM